MIHYQLFRPFLFGERFTGNVYINVFLRLELTTFLEAIPLLTSQQMVFQHDGSPIHFINLL